MNSLRFLLSASVLLGCLLLTSAQEKSVKPGINDAFKNPDVKKYVETFEGESREVFAKREEIVKAIGLKPGMAVADVGAGTGLYTRLFAPAVGEKGKVYAVDIADAFLKHIATTNDKLGIKNVTTVLGKPHSVELPKNSIDLAYICDTYHHFEFPSRTMASIHQALKAKGRVVLVDFKRIPGVSRDWTLNHVRAGQEVFEKEIIESGFKKVDEKKDILTENYFVIFEKIDAKPKFVYPVISDFGGVVPLADAVEQPAKGTKVIFDVTGLAKEAGKAAPGLERAAVLLNLAGASGLKSGDVELAIVLHGEATALAIEDSSISNNGILIHKLKNAGVSIYVCGQSLEKKGLAERPLRTEIRKAASALTVSINLQKRGFAVIMAP